MEIDSMRNKQKSEVADKLTGTNAPSLVDKKNKFVTQFDVLDWSKWIKEHPSISTKLLGARGVNRETYFLLIHAATEAMFRRVLLVGLRLNKVTYDEANEWLYHNDETPDKDNYPKLFNQLYQSKLVTWSDLLASTPALEALWTLWLGYSKIIRNHISHGIRKYNDDWLQCGITIDEELLIRLDQSLSIIIGGSVCDHLGKLTPRLPIGLKGNNLTVITGRKSRKPRPTVSLANAKIAIEGLTAR